MLTDEVTSTVLTAASTSARHRAWPARTLTVSSFSKTFDHWLARQLLAGPKKDTDPIGKV